MSTFLVDFYDEVEEEIDDIEPHKCNLCSFETEFEVVLHRHIFSAHPDPPSLNCPKCDYKTSSQETLQNHMIEHQKPNVCPHCEFRTKRRDNLRKHLENMHTNPSDIKWFQCDKCVFKCKWLQGLNRHQKKHENAARKCYFCEYTSQSRPALRAHMIRAHRSPEDLVKWLDGAK